MAKGRYEKWLTLEGLALICGWKMDGLSDEQVAKNIGVNVRTLYDWAGKYPQISQALKKGREVVISQVKNALVERARGYEYWEEVQELRFNKATGKSELTTIKRTKKHMAPDVGAIAFYLKNVDPKNWRDKPEAASDGANDLLQSLIDMEKRHAQ